jgi:hypothetical protein
MAVTPFQELVFGGNHDFSGLRSALNFTTAFHG